MKKIEKNCVLNAGPRQGNDPFKVLPNIAGTLLSIKDNQVVIAQWLARCLATGEVQGSNPGKRDNLLVSNLKRKLINSNLKAIMVWVYELTGQV